MSKDELGVAIVGSGDIARVHLPNIAKCPSMRLVATMDLVEEEARSLAEAGGAEYFTTDLDRVLADQEVDAVVICSALDTHVAISLEALSAGKHVFSEKPLAMTLEEARRLQRAAVETGMHLMSGWWFKHSPITSRVRQVIKEPNLVLTTLLIPDVYDLPPDDTRSPYSRGGILRSRPVKWYKSASSCCCCLGGCRLREIGLRKSFVEGQNGGCEASTSALFASRSVSPFSLDLPASM